MFAAAIEAACTPRDRMYKTHEAADNKTVVNTGLYVIFLHIIISRINSADHYIAVSIYSYFIIIFYVKILCFPIDLKAASTFMMITYIVEVCT